MPVAAGLYYLAHEAENIARPPVILIHGAGGSHLYWPPQVRRLHSQRIYAVDLPGHGKSEGVGHQLVSDYAQNILDFMHAVQLRAAVMIGHSMGSGVALHLAIHHPQKVLGLGLVGGGAKLHVAPGILQSAADPALFADTVQRVVGNSFAPQTSARLKELAEKRMLETRPAVLYGDFLACDAFDVTDQLSGLSLPTLIVCGAQDKMTPAKHSQNLVDNIGQARLEILPDAGHMAMLEQPDTVARLLLSFLEGIVYRPGQ